MGDERHRELLELASWRAETQARAEAVLPELLDLPPAAMSRALARNSEVRSGVIQLLLPLVTEAVEHVPRRAHELTSVMIEHVDQLDVPPILAMAVRCLSGMTWTTHAAALHALRKDREAQEACATALDRLRNEPAPPWCVAVAEAVEAAILHDLGRSGEALRQIRRAARLILRHGDQEQYVKARMTEAWIHLTSGDPGTAAEVWRSVAEEALQRGDRVLDARWSEAIGVYDLRTGRIAAAARHFSNARKGFENAGLAREAARVHRHLAEVAVARRRFHGAVSEYFTAFDRLLALGDPTGASLGAVEILDLLVLAGREDRVRSLAGRFARVFAATALPPNAVQAWAAVRELAAADELTRDDIAALREYFRELPLRPNARFGASAREARR